MFITSRESAISRNPVPLPLCLQPKPSKFPAPLFFGRRLILGDALALYVCPRAFGVPSIYQPGKTPRPSKFPVLAGFFKVFLEKRKVSVCSDFYMQRLAHVVHLLVVVVTQIEAGHFGSGN